jgi:hypothetical protein
MRITAGTRRSPRPAADLDAARPPRRDVLEVVDHERGAPRAPCVAELLRPLELVADDDDHVVVRVVSPADSVPHAPSPPAASARFAYVRSAALGLALSEDELDNAD